MLGRAEHRGPLMGQRHGRRSPGAAHFSYDGGAAHPVVTVLVVGTQWRQLLAIIQVRHGFVPGFGVPYALPGEERVAWKTPVEKWIMSVHPSTYRPAAQGPFICPQLGVRNVEWRLSLRRLRAGSSSCRARKYIEEVALFWAGRATVIVDAPHYQVHAL